VEPLLECVPNFSEGRNALLVQQLAAAMHRPPGVSCLGHEHDPDHHRCVITLAGRPAELADAILRGARLAIEAIDLRRHRGEHMRMGALDVCPFVPLCGTEMAVAVAAARGLADRLGRELGLPVYLYGHAALRPERAVLGAVRNLGFEALSQRVLVERELRPDAGPSHLHATAGATAVGARALLVAYNVNLAGVPIGVAREIARKVRESSGGLPGVQARGFSLPSRGLVQVSMNLLAATSGGATIRAAFDAVAAAARAARARVVESELIGLAAEAALDVGTAQHVLLRDFDPSARILEARLRAHGLL
jgi:glutamate formiminotransferase